MENNSSINGTADRIIERATAQLKEKDHLVIAVDGRCAAGKTTLAAVLKEKTDCGVIHMDDFFLRPEQRTKERLATPGGNVDYERFETEVLKPLRAYKDFSFRPYDCHTQSLKGPVEIRRNRITFVEGSYSCHPYLWDGYDLHVFLDVDKKTQRERILIRNGAEAAEIFADRWIPLEEKYFAAYGIKEKCEVQIKIPPCS